MDLELCTENNGDHGGEWSTAGSKNNKGKKQKKKFKNNARTVTLQTFISENGYREEKYWKELNNNTLKIIVLLVVEIYILIYYDIQ